MQDPSLTLRVCSSLHRVLDSLSVNPLAPEIMPLITQIHVFTRLQFDRPRDVAQAVEVAPPIGLTTRRRKSGIFKNIQPRDRCARSRSRIDNAQHMARHFDLQRVFAIIAQRNFARQVDAAILFGLPGFGVRRAPGFRVAARNANVNRRRHIDVGISASRRDCSVRRTARNPH